ncbi:GerAB/ArcD/ProY family transporter [Pradoshia sp.]
MQTKEKPLSPVQLYCTIILAITGIMMFSLPYIANLYAKNNAWLSVIILLVSFQLIGFFVMFLHKRFPDKNLFEIAEIVLGKAIGKTLNLLLSLYYLITAVYVCLYGCFLTMEWVLPLTPKPVIYLILLIPSLYLAMAKLDAFARYNSIAIFVTLGLIFAICFAIPDMQFSFLLPIGEVPLAKIFKAALHISPIYSGINCLLIYLPKTGGTFKAKARAVYSSIFTISLIYLFLVATCLALLGTDALKIVIMPVLYLLKTVTIFGFFERLDLLMISIWLIPSLSAFVIYMHMAYTGVTQVIQKKNKKILVALFILVFIGCVALQSQLSIYKLHEGRHLLLPYNFIAMFVVIPLLLILAIIRKKRQ